MRWYSPGYKGCTVFPVFPCVRLFFVCVSDREVLKFSSQDYVLQNFICLGRQNNSIIGREVLTMNKQSSLFLEVSIERIQDIFIHTLQEEIIWEAAL